MKLNFLASHHLFISLAHIGLRRLRGVRKWRSLVSNTRPHLLWFVAVLAAVAIAPSRAAAKPKPKETGRYDVKISGAYKGSGMALLNASGVVIRADVTDENGKAYKLATQRLARDPVRHNLFRGTGQLGGTQIEIDGRVDIADKLRSEVLHSGRIVFTFKVVSKGRYGRGAGEKVSGGKGGTDPDGGGSGGGGGNNGGGGGNSGGGGNGGGGGNNGGGNGGGGGNSGGGNGGGGGNSWGNGPGTGPGENPGNENPGGGGNDIGNPNGNPNGASNGASNAARGSPNRRR